MPIYEYKCSECNTKFEMLHKSVTSNEDVTCPNCNSSKIKSYFLRSFHQPILILIPQQEVALQVNAKHQLGVVHQVYAD
jgi:putative FmdB family regulatory protein